MVNGVSVRQNEIAAGRKWKKITSEITQISWPSEFTILDDVRLLSFIKNLLYLPWKTADISYNLIVFQSYILVEVDWQNCE